MIFGAPKCGLGRFHSLLKTKQQIRWSSDYSDRRLSPKIIAIVYQHSIFSPMSCGCNLPVDNVLVICPCSTFNHPQSSDVQTVCCKNHNQFQIISHKNVHFLRSAVICWYCYQCKAFFQTGFCGCWTKYCIHFVAQSKT